MGVVMACLGWESTAGRVARQAVGLAQCKLGIVGELIKGKHR